jgi:hypothetical protein
VRILEKAAHLRRNLRGFPRCALLENGAHLRTPCAPSAGRAAALHPVPFSRKVVQTLASASIALCCFEKNVTDKPPGCHAHADLLGMTPNYSQNFATSVDNLLGPANWFVFRTTGAKKEPCRDL